jgi:hypothetical protein
VNANVDETRRKRDTKPKIEEAIAVERLKNNQFVY